MIDMFAIHACVDARIQQAIVRLDPGTGVRILINADSRLVGFVEGFEGEEVGHGGSPFG